jgi:hypothetical protein
MIIVFVDHSWKNFLGYDIYFQRAQRLFSYSLSSSANQQPVISSPPPIHPKKTIMRTPPNESTAVSMVTQRLNEHGYEQLYDHHGKH